MNVPDEVKNEDLQHIADVYTLSLNDAGSKNIRPEYREAAAFMAEAMGCAWLSLHRSYEGPTKLDGGAMVQKAAPQIIHFRADDIVALATIIKNLNLPADQILHLQAYNRHNSMLSIAPAGGETTELYKDEDAYLKLQNQI